MRTKLILSLIALIAVGIGAVAMYILLRPPQSPMTIDVSRPSVIRQIRSLSRLETASYTIDKVIDGHTNESNAISTFLFGDKILLVAHGQVIAGIDLSQFSEADIDVHEHQVTVRLPAPQVLVASLDNSQTKVYDRSQGILKRNDTELESRVRQAAQDSIRQAACDGGILDTANANAKRQLQALLSGLGFETITIVTTPGTCK